MLLYELRASVTCTLTELSIRASACFVNLLIMGKLEFWVYVCILIVCMCVFTDSVDVYIICDWIWENPACRENAQAVQCTLFSTSGQKMSKSSFCHIHVKEPFY